jgi:uncharacterized protein YceK
MKTFVALAALLVLTGCASVVTLNPLYTGEHDLVQDLPIEGAWEDGEDVWAITRHRDGYTLIDNDGDRLKAHLVRIGDARYLDVEPAEKPPLTMAVHMILKVSIEDGKLCVAVMDSDWFRNELRTVGVETRDALLLTASTAELRRIVEQYGGDARAFGDTSRMKRLR